MSEHNPKTCGCRYVGNDAWTCGHVDNELFEAPFNLAGELIDNSTTAEGEARVRALAEAAARRAQRTFFECGGTFDGFSCGSDADSGL